MGGRLRSEVPWCLGLPFLVPAEHGPGWYQQDGRVRRGLMLPGLPGEEVARSLRAVSDVPITMLTAKAGEADRMAGCGRAATTTWRVIITLER